MTLSLLLLRLMILALLAATECPLATLGMIKPGPWGMFPQTPIRTKLEASAVPQVSRPVASCSTGHQVKRYRVLSRLKESKDGIMSVAHCIRVGGAGIELTRGGTTACELPIQAAGLYGERLRGTCYAHSDSDADCTGPPILGTDTRAEFAERDSVRVNDHLYISAEDCKRRQGEDFMPITATAYGGTPKLWEGCLKLSAVTPRPSRYTNLKSVDFQIHGLCFGKPDHEPPVRIH